MSTNQSPSARPAKRPRNHNNRKPKPPGGPKVAQLSTSAAPASGSSTPALNSFDSTPAATPRATSPTLSKTFSQTKFIDFVQSGQISAATAVGIQRGGFVNCTEVQAQTLPVAITGVDLLAQARTGTGKTLAFLIPSIERLIRAPQQPQRGQISVLILSPTRELAIQIQDSANVLLAGTPYSCDHVVGGTNMKSEINRLNKQQTDILVATPGRLQDHLENSNLKAKMSSLRVLILDEADRLLEAGFRREIEKIIVFLPNRTNVPRQTLLFSATIPQQVHQIASLALLPNHAFVSTIPPEEENTHEHVPQYSVTPPSIYDLFPTTLAVLKDEIKTHGADAKTMVFFPTARATGLAAALFKRAGLQAYGQEIFEIHSRKSQGQRNAAAEAFKNIKGGVLFSSDVTARGMDFPNVTAVIQVGIPQTPEQYVHRLGRTARGSNATGQGIIILAPFESFFLRKSPVISTLPIKPHPLTATILAPTSATMQDCRQVLNKAMHAVGDDEKNQFYGATLGFYKAFLRDAFGGNAGEMVKVWNDFATSPDGLGCQEIPGMLAKTVGKMGLKGTPGLRIVKELGNGEGGGNPRGGNAPRGGGASRGGGRGGANGGGGRGGGGGGRVSTLAHSFDSLQRSSALLASLSFPNAAVLPRTVLASVGQFETTALREVQPHENGLFHANRPTIDTWVQQEEDGLLLDSDKWTATKRRAPKRVEISKDKPSPLEDHAAAQGKDDPERCLRAAQKLLEVYPLPRASEHVEALHSQWLGVIDSIAELEEELRQPLPRTGPEVQHDESYYRLLSLEDEIKREELELLALQQFKQERESELAALKPLPTRKPGPAARKVPSVVARSQNNRPAGPDGKTSATARRPVETESPPSDLADRPRPRSRSSTPRTSQTPDEKTDPRRKIRPSVPSAQPTPKVVTSRRKSLASAPETTEATKPEAKIRPATKPSPLSVATRSSPAPSPAKDRLPVGVAPEELEAIGKSIWRLIGDSLRPWARKWARDQSLERSVDDEGLGIEDTIRTLESVLKAKFARDPASPSSASISSYATSQAVDDAADPSPPSPSTLVEFKLLHLLLSIVSSANPPTLPPSLPALPIIFRDPPADSSTSPSARLTKTPCLSMNALKAHLGAFAVERGWTEGMGTTAIYALISKQVARIDRRGKEGAVVGFKL
ncbi:hypothetical protein JCM11491_006111 [Sporobolomyces phaffii]